MNSVYVASIYETHIPVKGQLLDFSELTFGERLRFARTAAGLTQVALAQALGIRQNQISVWEAGTSGPHRDRLPIIASKVGTTVDWLLTGKGAAPHPTSDAPPALPAVTEDLEPRRAVEVRRPKKAQKKRRAQGSRPRRPPARPPAPQGPRK